MTPSGHTAVYAVLGRPVRHTRSPAIHNALFARHGLDAVYVALEVPEGVAAGPILRCLAGANVTTPLKTEVAAACDALTPLAAALGAVNTVVARDGRLLGDNTDAEGFVRSLAGHAVALDRVAVLGAGGAARAVAAGVAAEGARQVRFLNRSVERAEASAAQLAPHFPATRFDAGPLAPDALSWAPTLVVNATAGPGRARVESLVVPDAPLAWADLNYWMPDPPHLAAVAASGRPAIDGLGMLAHQAALAFRRWTGVVPDVDVVLRALS